MGLYARGSVSEDGDRAVFGGLRFYFGERPKSLIRHLVKTILQR